MFEAMLAGLALGFAELTKFTLLIFYPLFIALWLLYRKPTVEQLKQISVTFLISIFIINAGYLFEGTFTPIGQFKFQTALFTGYDNYKDVPGGGGNRLTHSILGYIPLPLPVNYIQGIDTQRLDFERGLPSYLRGEWSNHGWRSYYLYALLLKTPLGTLGLFLLAIYCTFFIKNCNSPWRDEMVVLLPGIVLLAFVSSQTGFSIHSRYIIPALPFFFVWMSKVGQCFVLRKKCLSVVVSALMVWSIFSSLWMYPHSLSYFNELALIIPTPLESRSPQEPAGTSSIVSILNAGARNGGRHLLDSNIDWGQNLFYLEKWCAAHPEVTNISVALWGSYPAEQTTIPITKTMPPANNPQAGWYALSVNYLYDRDKQYRYFLNIKPAARIGYSVYVYHITEDDVK
ncbi:hypothetical protein FACS189427_12480 [Planctomycetales bacterium]|nr:hypothetical protein FACS189427_12480 [Planctomycetales bacterium]